ncbi:MAG: prepilin-type N-terminal cleavage/methylation domain-containing protein, partial [Nitrospirae bacterium]|nr:prepilin-type N-terminal cleavage/methylation domain-containing protein [Nitrospirota bacterium]
MNLRQNKINQPRIRGLTLLELLITLSIIMILASMVLPFSKM